MTGKSPKEWYEGQVADSAEPIPKPLVGNGQPGPGRGNKTVDNVNGFTQGGNSADYTRRRLARDRPDLLEKVAESELSLNAAAEIQSYVHPGQGARTDLQEHSSNITKSEPAPPPARGTTAAYTLNRLRRDHGDLFEKVKAGEMTANAAAIEAGFRKKLTPFQQVMALLPKLTEAERDQLRRSA